MYNIAWDEPVVKQNPHGKNEQKPWGSGKNDYTHNIARMQSKYKNPLGGK